MTRTSLLIGSALLFGYTLTCVAGVHLLKASMTARAGEEPWVFGASRRQASLFGTGFICAGLGFLLWLLLLRRLPASTAFPIGVGASTLGVLALGWWLGEAMSAGKLVGVALILVGIVLVGRAEVS